MSKLAVVILGHRNSGKSTTWNELFGRPVRTGSELRTLTLPNGEGLPVFLVSGSPEERSLYVGDIVEDANPRVVLCSVQYTESGRETLSYFMQNGFDLYVQWLNPGRTDDFTYPDALGYMPFLLHAGATVCIRDGQAEPRKRVREVAAFLMGWASSRRF